MPDEPLKQIYLQDEEAEEIVEFLKRSYPNDGVTVTRENLFYGAVARPLNKAYYSKQEPSIEEHAALQMMAFAEAHALNNANKRLAVLSAYFVLKNNGYSLTKWKRLYRCSAPIVEKIIKYKGAHYNFGFLCLSIRFFMAEEESTLPVTAYEKRLKSRKDRASKKKKRKRESRKRKS